MTSFQFGRRGGLIAGATLLAVVVVLGVLPARAGSSSLLLPGTSPGAVRELVDALEQPTVATRASSEVWYCTAPPGMPASTASVELVNVRTRSELVQLAPRIGAQGRKVLLVAHTSTMVPFGSGQQLVVEARGGVGAVVVSRTSFGPQATPCFSSASDTWSVLGFATTAGARAWVRIANPFPAPAVVSVDPIGPGGLVQEVATQGLVIEPGASATLNVVQLAPGQIDGGVLVDAKNGRVVVTGSTEAPGAFAPTVLAAQESSAGALSTAWVPTVGLRVLRVVLANPSASVVRATVRVVGLRGASGSVAAAANQHGVSETVVVPANSTVVVPLTADALAEPTDAVAVSVRARGGTLTGALDLVRRGVEDQHSVWPMAANRANGWLLVCAPSAGIEGVAFDPSAAGAQVTLVQQRREGGAGAFEATLLRSGVIGLPEPSASWVSVRASIPVSVAPVEPSSSCVTLGLEE